MVAVFKFAQFSIMEIKVFVNLVLIKIVQNALNQDALYVRIN